MKFGLAPAAIMAYLGEYALPRFAFPLVLFGDPIAPQQARQIASSRTSAGEHSRLRRRCHHRAHPSSRSERARNCKEFFQTAQQNSFDQTAAWHGSLDGGSMAVLSRQK